jgi:ABC-type multidrug transport system fused ATPase/permease subunit
MLACGQVGQYQAQVTRHGQVLARAQERMAAIRGIHGALSGLLATLAGLAMLAIGIPLVRAAQLDGVYLALIALTAMAAFEAVTPLSQAAQHLSSSVAAARRLFALADSPPLVRDPVAASPVPLHSGIDVRGLSFVYPKTEHQAPGIDQSAVVLGAPSLALNHVSFSLRPGQCMAIVGPSGAGKSTLIQLLLRFWEYEHGQIWLGGHALRHYRAEDARRMISVVAQDTHLFNGTIRENLLLARPGASADQLVAAAEQAQIHTFIQGLPHGYDTWIGEQGLRLSGGERQRLALARAALKDSPILILDEPTAHLDAHTEQQLLRSLGPLMDQRTTLMITHRLVGLENMDTIIVLDRGCVVEQGQHHDLLLLGGYYWRMWERQHAIERLKIH